MKSCYYNGNAKEIYVLDTTLLVRDGVKLLAYEKEKEFSEWFYTITKNMDICFVMCFSRFYLFNSIAVI